MPESSEKPPARETSEATERLQELRREIEGNDNSGSFERAQQTLALVREERQKPYGNSKPIIATGLPPPIDNAGIVRYLDSGPGGQLSDMLSTLQNKKGGKPSQTDPAHTLLKNYEVIRAKINRRRGSLGPLPKTTPEEYHLLLEELHQNSTRLDMAPLNVLSATLYDGSAVGEVLSNPQFSFWHDSPAQVRATAQFSPENLMQKLQALEQKAKDVASKLSSEHKVQMTSLKKLVVKFPNKTAKEIVEIFENTEIKIDEVQEKLDSDPALKKRWQGTVREFVRGNRQKTAEEIVTIIKKLDKKIDDVQEKLKSDPVLEKKWKGAVRKLVKNHSGKTAGEIVTLIEKSVYCPSRLYIPVNGIDPLHGSPRDSY